MPVHGSSRRPWSWFPMKYYQALKARAHNSIIRRWVMMIVALSVYSSACTEVRSQTATRVDFDPLTNESCVVSVADLSAAAPGFVESGVRFLTRDDSTQGEIDEIRKRYEAAYNENVDKLHERARLCCGHSGAIVVGWQYVPEVDFKPLGTLSGYVAPVCLW